MPTDDLFRAMAEATGEGIAIADVDAMRLCYVNPALCRFLGYRAEELLQQPVQMLHHPEDWERVATHFLLEQPSTFVVRDLPCRHKDGSTRYADISQAHLSTDASNIKIGIFSDVSNRHAMKAELEASELRHRETAQLLEAVFDAIPDVIGIQDLQHRVQRYNEAGYRFVQATPESAKGKRCWELIGRTQPCATCAVRSAIEQKTSVQLEKHLPELDLWLDCRAYPVLDAHGGLRCVVEHLRDITETRRLQEQLRHAEKMQAIGELAGGLAHDFNNQLGAISGLAELLRFEVEERPDALELVDAILLTIERASTLTQQVLAFSRRGNFLTIPVDVHAIVHEVRCLLRHSIDKRIHIDLRLHATRPTTLGDPSQIQNALLNLALNARDAMPHGGSLVFSSSIVTLDDASKTDMVLALPHGEYLELCVKDDGMGMAPATLQRAFEPFFTTKTIGRGFGMGLAAVYGTMKNHRGGIAVHSEVGQGTSFKLYFPIHTAAPPSADKKVGPRAAAMTPAKILVIDDEPMLSKIVRTVLERFGHQVHCQPDGRSALDFFRQHADAIDVVLLDVVLPDQSPQHVLTELLAIKPTCKVILLSGYSIDGEAQSLLENGALAFLQKPFRGYELALSIESALAIERPRDLCTTPDAKSSDDQ